MKFTIVFLLGLVVSPFQVHATLLNGGFEDGSRWGNLTEFFGTWEVASSYTDARGITFTPTEGSFFLDFWGNEDLWQGVSWKKGDQLSYDWAETVGTRPEFGGISLLVYPTEDISLVPFLSEGINIFDSVTGFTSTTHTFTEDSLEFSGLVFQAQGISTLGFDPETNPAIFSHILLDNVKITSVSSPGGVLLMIVSLPFWVSRHRRISRKRESAQA